MLVVLGCGSGPREPSTANSAGSRTDEESLDEPTADRRAGSQLERRRTRRPAVAPWPPGAAPGGSYTVALPEAVMNDPSRQIVLPNNFTLYFEPNVQVVDWTVDSISFGQGCTIDLSSPQTLPPTPATPPPPAGSPTYFVPGTQGLSGPPGLPGRAGVQMVLRVNSSGATGGLWIRTDGGPAGAGAAGGRGQHGGPTKCGGSKRTKGPPGGKGGTGGPGGAGGSTSVVTIENAALPVGFVFNPNACATTCGRSTRPSAANVNDGSIVIWGGSGCGGAGGKGGQPGPADRSKPKRGPCYEFPFINYYVRAGNDGPPGSPGPGGPAGQCGSAESRGPLS